jgi:Zinc dependent phospholipase C
MPEDMINRGIAGIRSRLVILCIAVLVPFCNLHAYSVLSHEALIDAAWDSVLVPLLRSRYPNAKLAQLREAHAYAYGGCVIQDMGYYPFGNHFFSELTHYVRTGNFIQALLADSQNLNEYAFALGALSHYVADNMGHPLAVNLAVPAMYPKLRQKYGKVVTYEDDPRAHVMTEFSFDVVQITGAGYLPRTYHNFIGFKVPKALLDRAFYETYGLQLSKLFLCERLSVKLYEMSASEIIPALGQALWTHQRKGLMRLNPEIVRPKFPHRLSPENYEAPRGRRPGLRKLRPWTWHWKSTAEKANVGLVTTFIVTLIEVLPKIGALRTLRFKPPSLEVQHLFISSFDVTVTRYESDLSDLHKKTLLSPNKNLDIGQPTRAGQYELADESYAELLHKHSKHHFRSLPTGLRREILDFYSNLNAPIATKEHTRRWRKLIRDIEELKSWEARTRQLHIR